MTAPVSKPGTKTPLRVVKITAANARHNSAGSGHSDNNNNNINNHSANPQNKIPLEEMVNKGLDLAETGIGLGVNIVARLGSIFKDQVFDKLSGTELFNSVTSQTGVEPPPQPQTHQAAASEPAASSEPANYLFNRIPLAPGSDVSLSFSINNDSLTSVKTVQLKIEAFESQAQHFRIDAQTFSVTPSHINIAPADFEKFVIKGKIPSDAPADNYYGWIIVSEQQSYQIPVVLVVTREHHIAARPNASATPQQQPEASAKTEASTKTTTSTKPEASTKSAAPQAPEVQHQEG